MSCFPALCFIPACMRMCEVEIHLPQSVAIGGRLEWLNSVPGCLGNPVIDDCIDGILIYGDISAL